MSDSSTTTDAVAAAVTAAAPAPAGEVVDWQAKHAAEVADRVRERNLYKPVARVFEGLSDDDVRSITDLAAAVRNGDRDGIIDWSIQTAEGVSGKGAAELIAERQAAARGGVATPDAGDAAPLTAERVAELVSQQLQKDRAAEAQTKQMEAGRQAVEAEMTELGFPPGTPHHDIIIRHCVQTGSPIASGVQWYKGEVAAFATAQQAQAIAAAAATAVPGTVPAGSPASTVPQSDMSRREKIISRLGQTPGQ